MIGGDFHGSGLGVVAFDGDFAVLKIVFVTIKLGRDTFAAGAFATARELAGGGFGDGNSVAVADRLTPGVVTIGRGKGGPDLVALEAVKSVKGEADDFRERSGSCGVHGVRFGWLGRHCLQRNQLTQWSVKSKNYLRNLAYIIQRPRGPPLCRNEGKLTGGVWCGVASEQLTLNFAATVIPTSRPDGGYLVIPGKPVVMEDELEVAQVAQLLKYSPRHVRRLLQGMGSRQRRRGCKHFVPASAVAQLRSLKS